MWIGNLPQSASALACTKRVCLLTCAVFTAVGWVMWCWNCQLPAFGLCLVVERTPEFNSTAAAH
jgi:hypothetical protein